MNLYKRILRFFREMTVAWKFTLAYFIILALPIVVIGFYISDSTTKSIISQSALLAKQNLLQKREIINLKVESLERTSISIACNPQILKYLGDPFENNYRGYENYFFTFSPLYEGYIIQNEYIYDTMIYLDSESFPNGWNGIYHIDTVQKDEWYGKFLEDTTLLKKWSYIHNSKTKKVTGDIGRERVFSLCRKLISFNDKSCIGILEIEIPEKMLFSNLRSAKDTVEYYIVFDERGNVVSENSYKDVPEKLKADFVSTLKDKDMNGVFTFDHEQFAVYSIPLDNIGCRLAGIIPMKSFMKGSPDHKVIITGVIVIGLLLFGTIIHFVTNRLTRRLKLLVKGLKSVQDENINIKMPVGNHDEFGELAESFNHMTDRIHGLIERVYKAQILEKESELKALEAQINPHFLYNALSTISWMARKVNAENIDNLSLQLSRFYRLVLSKGNSIITVEDEINLLKAYVEIEKIRFENMFLVKYDLDEQALNHRMVKIILQPIAENTINHGIAPKNGRGTMIVRLRQDKDSLSFTIIDDGVGMSAVTLENIKKGQIIKSRESGYAIHNVMERLRSVYGDEGQVTIFSRPGIGCAVNIVIPKSPMLPNF